MRAMFIMMIMALVFLSSACFMQMGVRLFLSVLSEKLGTSGINVGNGVNAVR